MDERLRSGLGIQQKKIGKNNMRQKAQRHRIDNGLEEIGQLPAPEQDAHALVHTKRLLKAATRSLEKAAACAGGEASAADSTAAKDGRLVMGILIYRFLTIEDQRL